MKVLIFNLFLFSFLFSKPYLDGTQIIINNESGDTTFLNKSVSKYPIENKGQYTVIREIYPVAKDHFIYLPPIRYPYRVYIDSNLIACSFGDFNSYTTLGNLNSFILPLDFIADGNKHLLRIEIVSDGNDQVIKDIRIDNRETIQNYYFEKNLLNFRLVQVIDIFGAIIAFFLLFYWALLKGKERLILLASMYAFSVFLAFNMYVFNGSVISGLLSYKLARIGALGMSLFMVLFVVNATHYLSQKKYVFIILVAFIPYLYSIITAQYIYDVNMAFIGASNTLFFPLLFLGIVLIIIKLFKDYRDSYLLLLLTYTILLIAVILDISEMIQGRIPKYWKIPYGNVVIIIGMVIFILQMRIKRFSSIIATQKSNEERLKNTIAALNEKDGIVKFAIDEFLTTYKGYKNIQINNIDSIDEKFIYDFVYLKSLVNSIDFYNKFKNSNLELWNDGINISSYLEEYRTFVDYLSKDRSVQIDVNIEEKSLPPLIWCDGDAFALFIYILAIVSTDIEEKRVTITIVYIPYQGLEITVNGCDDLFAGTFQEIIEGEQNGINTLPTATILLDLYHIFNGEGGVGTIAKDGFIRFVLPLKVVEDNE